MMSVISRGRKLIFSNHILCRHSDGMASLCSSCKIIVLSSYNHEQKNDSSVFNYLLPEIVIFVLKMKVLFLEVLAFAIKAVPLQRYCLQVRLLNY